MNGIILGGATFIGHSINKALQEKYQDINITVLDLIRPSYFLYKTPHDKYIDIRDIKGNQINNSFSFVIINFYDLLDSKTLKISRDKNNLLIHTVNILLDLIITNKAQLILIVNKHFYSEPKTRYQKIYNGVVEFYIQYFNVTSQIEGFQFKLFLLPNIYGRKESKRSIVRTIFSKIISQEDLILEKTERDFIYIDDFIKRLLEDIFNPDYKIVEYYSEEKHSLQELYKYISEILNAETDRFDISPNYFLKRIDYDETNYIKIPSKIEDNLYKIRELKKDG